MYLGQVAAPAPGSAEVLWVDKLLDIGKGALALKQQRDIQKINLQRLQQGLSPIDASDVAVGAKIAMDTKQLNKILLVTGGGLAMIALVALSRRR